MLTKKRPHAAGHLGSGRRASLGPWAPTTWIEEASRCEQHGAEPHNTIPMVNTPILHGRRADFRNIGQGVNIGRDKSALMANTQDPRNTQNTQNTQRE